MKHMELEYGSLIRMTTWLPSTWWTWSWNMEADPCHEIIGPALLSPYNEPIFNCLFFLTKH